MSYISPSGNVGYQSLAENNYVSQYRMAVETKYDDRQMTEPNHNYDQMVKTKAPVRGKTKVFSKRRPAKLNNLNKNTLALGKTAKDPNVIKMLSGVLKTNGYPEQKPRNKGPNFKMCSSKPKDLQRSSTHNEQKSDNSHNSNSINNLSIPTSSSSMSFLEVFKREQIDRNERTAFVGKVKNPGSKPSVNSTATKSNNLNKIARGRGPAVHEALQRLPATKSVEEKQPLKRPLPPKPRTDLNKLIGLGWHAPLSPSELNDDGLWSSDEESLPPVYSSYVWTDISDLSTDVDVRLRRLASRRAGLRRRLPVAELEAGPDEKYHKIAELLQKDVSERNVGSSINATLLDAILATRGLHSVLSSEERLVLRSGGWSSSGSQNASCTWGAGKQLLDAVLSRKMESDLAIETPNSAVKPKRAPRRRNPPHRSRNTKRRRHNTHVSHVSTELSICSNSSYESAEDISPDHHTGQTHSQQSGRKLTVISPENVVRHETVDRCDSRLSNHGHQHGIDVSLCASNTSVNTDDMLDTSVLQHIPDEAFTAFFTQETGSELGEPEELARALEAVLEDTSLNDVFTHRSRIPLQTAATVEVYSTDPS